MTWEEIKQSGSDHYKAGAVEPIDLLRDLKPDSSLTALEVKALTDCIKYAYRMLRKGTNTSDLGKIKHYATMCEWKLQGEQAEADRPKTKPPWNPPPVFTEFLRPLTPAVKYVVSDEVPDGQAWALNQMELHKNKATIEGEGEL